MNYWINSKWPDDGKTLIPDIWIRDTYFQKDPNQLRIGDYIVIYQFKYSPTNKSIVGQRGVIAITKVNKLFDGTETQIVEGKIFHMIARSIVFSSNHTVEWHNVNRIMEYTDNYIFRGKGLRSITREQFERFNREFQ